MAEAKLDITGSVDTANRNIEKLTKTVAGLHERIRVMNQESVRGAREAVKGLDAWAAGMARLKASHWDKGAGGLSEMGTYAMMSGKASAGPGLGGMWRGAFTKSAIDGISASMGSLAARVVGVGAAVGVVTSGYRAWSNEIDKVIHGHTELSMKVVQTLAEAGKLNLGPKAEAFAKGVKGATPEQAMAALGGVLQSGETLSDQRSFAVAGEIAKLAPTGMELAPAGGLAADIADIVGEGVSAQDVADLTVGIKQQLRGKTEMFSGQKFQKNIEALKASKHMTGMEALVHAVAAAQSEQGPEALKTLAHKGARTADQNRLLREAFAPDTLAKIRSDLASYQTGNVAEAELGALGGFAAGREALGEQGVRIEEAKTQEQLGPLSTQRERIRRLAIEKAQQKGRFPGMIASMAGYGPSQIVDFFQGQEGAGISQVQTLRQNNAISQKQADDLIAGLRAAAAASREVAKKNRAVNVDAHTE